MKRFIVVSFFFLGSAFYELSGGADFEPTERAVVVAEASDPAPEAPVDFAEQQTAATTAPQTQSQTQSQAQAEPIADAPAQRVSVILTSAPVSTQTLPAAIPPAAVEPERAAIAEEANDGTAVTLVSLEQSGTLFAQPIGRLDETATGAVAATTTAEPEPAPQDVRSVSGRRVNMRNGPGTNYSVITSLTRGTEVEILQEADNGWYKLRPLDGGQIGWMVGQFLSDPTG